MLHSAPEQELVEDFCEHDDETSGFLKGKKFLTSWGNY